MSHPDRDECVGSHSHAKLIELTTATVKQASLGSLFDGSSLIRRAFVRFLAYVFLLFLTSIAWLSKRRFIIIVSPFGNLGNRLFLFANVIAFARQNRAIVINPAFHPWRYVFAGTRSGLLPVYPSPPLSYCSSNLIEQVVQQLAWVSASIAKSPRSLGGWDSISIDGMERVDLDNPDFVAWFQKKSVLLISGYQYISESSMCRHADTIRHYFKQISGNDAFAIAPVVRLRQHCDLVIGVVVRYGGFDRWMGGKYFFNIATYARWISQINELFSQQRMGFFICSDADLDLGILQHVRYEFRSRSDLENRAALSVCDMIISPPSSYAGWAAFMGNIPFQILHSPLQDLSKERFVRIHNHMDLRDDVFPPDISRTAAVIQH